MKKLSLVVHSSLQQELADFLRNKNVEMFMFSHIEEHSSQKEFDALLSARDKVVGYVPKIRVDMILDNDRTQTLLEEFRNGSISLKGKGLYWVTDLQQAGEL